MIGAFPTKDRDLVVAYRPQSLFPVRVLEWLETRLTACSSDELHGKHTVVYTYDIASQHHRSAYRMRP